MAWKIISGICLIFMRAVESLEVCTLMGFFCQKHIKIDEKVQKSYVSKHWRVMQSLKKKLTLDSKNDMRNLVNFNLSSGKSENLHFDLLLLSIAFKVSAEKVQQNYLSWHWKEIQTLKKNWFFVWKITWGVWWTLTRAAGSLKVCTWLATFVKIMYCLS